jgi:hypothetical protein
MRRISWVLLIPVVGMLAGSCGGSAFTTGGGADGGNDSTSSPVDGSGDTLIVVGGDASSSGSGEAGDKADSEASASEAGETGGADAAGDTSAETSAPDAVADVVEEPLQTCGGSFACVLAAPQGWSGPVELYAGSRTAPPCTADFTLLYDGNDQPSASPANCTCSCTPPTTPCTPPALGFYPGGVCAGSTCCSGATCDEIPLQAGVCTTVNAPPTCGGTAGFAFMNAPGPTASVGSCTPQAGKQIPQLAWGGYAQACSATTAVVQADCQSGSVCAPIPAAPYGQAMCISQAGDVACPAQGYTSKQLFYGSVDDTRSCTGCTCGALTGVTCAASIDVFTSTNGSCTGTMSSYATPISCQSADQPADTRLALTVQDGSCTPTGGTATGSVTPTIPTTFCCLP